MFFCNKHKKCNHSVTAIAEYRQQKTAGLSLAGGVRSCSGEVVGTVQLSRCGQDAPWMLLSRF